MLTVLPETGILRFEHLASEEELVFRLKQLLESGEEVAISATFGFRLQISKPPLRYLVSPWGNTPLFEPLPQLLSLEDDGYIGKRYELPAAEVIAPDVDDTAEEAEEDQPRSTVDESTNIFASTDFDDDDDGS